MLTSLDCDGTERQLVFDCAMLVFTNVDCGSLGLQYVPPDYGRALPPFRELTHLATSVPAFGDRYVFAQGLRDNSKPQNITTQRLDRVTGEVTNIEEESAWGYLVNVRSAATGEAFALLGQPAYDYGETWDLCIYTDTPKRLRNFSPTEDPVLFFAGTYLCMCDRTALHDRRLLLTRIDVTTLAVTLFCETVAGDELDVLLIRASIG